MNIQFMRAVDFWVGVPLCFLFSHLFLVFRSLRFKPKKLDIEIFGARVLMIELSEMGSAILVDPMMRHLKEQGAELYFVIFQQNAASLSLLKTVSDDHIFKIKTDGFLALSLSTLQFLWWCRRKKISIIFDLELFSRFTSLLTLFSGAPCRVGFSAYTAEGLYRGTRVLTHPVFYNPYLHISKNFMALAHSLHADRCDQPLLKEVIGEVFPAKAVVIPEQTERVKSSVAKLFLGLPVNAQFILLNTIGGDFLPQRRWPKKHFVNLARMILAAKPTTYILFTGAESERSQIDEMVQDLDHERASNFAGEIKFQDLPALYQMSKLMLTNDSGPAHFASTTNLPAYVLFGPETPHLYGALGEHFYPLYLGLACSPCVSATNHRKTNCTNNICLKQMSPEWVFREIQKSL